MDIHFPDCHHEPALGQVICFLSVSPALCSPGIVFPTRVLPVRSRLQPLRRAEKLTLNVGFVSGRGRAVQYASIQWTVSRQQPSRIAHQEFTRLTLKTAEAPRFSVVKAMTFPLARPGDSSDGIVVAHLYDPARIGLIAKSSIVTKCGEGIRVSCPRIGWKRGPAAKCRTNNCKVLCFRDFTYNSFIYATLHEIL